MVRSQTLFSSIMTHTCVIQILSVMGKANEINGHDAYDTYDACLAPQLGRRARR